MTVLSTVTPGAKPPISLPTQFEGRHGADMGDVEEASGGTSYATPSTGVPETILDISGAGVIQFVYAGATASGGNTTAELVIDGVSVYSHTKTSTNNTGFAMCGGCYMNQSLGFSALTYGNYSFNESFQVIVTTTTASLQVVANYYLV